jgi:hypothetical protein
MLDNNNWQKMLDDDSQCWQLQCDNVLHHDDKNNDLAATIHHTWWQLRSATLNSDHTLQRKHLSMIDNNDVRMPLVHVFDIDLGAILNGSTAL